MLQLWVGWWYEGEGQLGAGALYEGSGAEYEGSGAEYEGAGAGAGALYEGAGAEYEGWAGAGALYEEESPKGAFAAAKNEGKPDLPSNGFLFTCQCQKVVKTAFNTFSAMSQ